MFLLAGVALLLIAGVIFRFGGSDANEFRPYPLATIISLGVFFPAGLELLIAGFLSL